LSAIQVEQTFIEAKIPFRIICDEHLSELSPATCKVLVLPDAECLSDEQLAAVRKYVAAGGGLVATEQTAFYDAWHRMRVESGLKDVIDGQVPEGHHRREAGSESAAQPRRKQYGSGRTVYLPVLEWDGAKPPDEPYFTLGTEFWNPPKNWTDLIDAVAWAAGDELPVSR
jgi:hypothetical protein